MFQNNPSAGWGLLYWTSFSLRYRNTDGFFHLRHLIGKCEQPKCFKGCPATNSLPACQLLRQSYGSFPPSQKRCDFWNLRSLGKLCLFPMSQTKTSAFLCCKKCSRFSMKGGNRNGILDAGLEKYRHFAARSTPPPPNPPFGLVYGKACRTKVWLLALANLSEPGML